MGAGPSAPQIMSLGVSLPPGEGPYVDLINTGWTRSMEQASRTVARGLGVEWEGITLDNVEYALAPEDYVLAASGLEIRKGMAAGIRWTLTARADGRDFFRLVNEQSTRLDHGPDWRKSYGEPAWRVEIDGDPSIVCTFGWPEGTEPGKACHDLNALRSMNIIPRLVEAPPGALSVLDFPAPAASDGLAA
jgi:4-hydroxy-tetrahydrodipicolinate reductase